MSLVVAHAHQRAEHLRVGRQWRVGRRGVARGGRLPVGLGLGGGVGPGARRLPVAERGVERGQARRARRRRRGTARCLAASNGWTLMRDESAVRVLEQRPRAGGEVREARADADDHVGLRGERVGRAGAGDADRAHRQRMVGRESPTCRPGSRRPGCRGAAQKSISSRSALGIEHAAAADDERLLGAAQQRGAASRTSRGSGATRRCRCTRSSKKRLGIVVRLGLHVLAEGERHRPAFGRIGQHRHRPVQRRHDLLGPDDAVEIARHRPEAVVGADRAVAEVLDLLQHRIGLAVGEDVAGDQQHRQPVDMRDRGGGDHVGRARADRGGAGHHPPAPRRLGEGDRRMRHRLLVVGAVGRQLSRTA